MSQDLQLRNLATHSDARHQGQSVPVYQYVLSKFNIPDMCGRGTLQFCSRHNANDPETVMSRMAMVLVALVNIYTPSYKLR